MPDRTGRGDATAMGLLQVVFRVATFIKPQPTPVTACLIPLESDWPNSPPYFDCVYQVLSCFFRGAKRLRCFQE